MSGPGGKLSLKRLSDVTSKGALEMNRLPPPLDSDYRRAVLARVQLYAAAVIAFTVIALMALGVL